MRTNDKKTVHFAKDATVEPLDNGKFMLSPIFGSKAVTRSHTKRYHNCLYLLAGLGGCARDLMDFITEEMDDSNIVSTNGHFRSKFCAFIKNTTTRKVVGSDEEQWVEYSESSVKRALRILTEKGLIRNMRRGYSKVNPEYFFKNDDTKRAEMISIELRFKSGYDTKIEVLRDKYKDKLIENDTPTELVKSKEKEE